jgi:hypothetical protein
MPAPIESLDLTAESLELCEETEVSMLAAGDPVFKDFVPDDFKAYIRFRICTAFPNVIGPEMHGRYFGFHPQVLVNSFRSLLHQQTNLGHMLKLYGAYRDRIQGGIVGVSVGKGGGGYRPAGKIQVPETVEEAPYLDVIAVLWKMAEGNKELLGKHISAREKTNVSIEVATTMADLQIYNPTDKSIHSMQDALAQWPDLIKRDKKNGIQIGQVDGVQFAFAAGGAAGTVPFRGVGYTPRPAETKTAKIIDLAAEQAGEDIAFAAMVTQDWEPGMEVTWPPIIHGRDAGRGIIKEVIFEGKHSRHQMTKIATEADPLLLLQIHGARIEVLRHASSVVKA